MEITELEDGSVELGSPEVEPDDTSFMANLAEQLDDEELAGISAYVLEKVDEDKNSRSEWLEAYSQGLNLLGLRYENRSEPFDGATGVVHPMLNEAVTQFQSQAYKELIPAKGPVRTQVMGKTTPDLENQAERVQDYMNYTLMHTMKEYESEFDQMLYYLGLGGSAFKKVYVDPQLGRQVSKFVEAKDMLVPFNASDLDSADRVTQIITMSENELRKLQVSKLYRDIEIKSGQAERDEVDDTKESITGIYAQGDYEEVQLFECHCYLDLEQYADRDESGEETGIKLPYIVTVSADNGEVLSVYRNYDEQDTFKNKKQYFIHYMFTPGLGFYGNGLIHLLGNLSRAATANLRQLIDSGTLANMPSGFKARGLRIKNDDEPLRPGEWRDVDVVGDQLKNSFFNLPYQEPSSTLFQLLGFVVQAAQKFVGTTDMGTGNINNQEMPVGTTIALLERGSRIISAVHKRIYNSLKQEFSLLANLISQEGGAYPYTEEGDKAQDFSERIDILPIANPNIFSMSQRISLAQEQLKLASSKPEMHNLYEAYRRVYNSLGVDNVEQILPPPTQPQPLNAVIENGKAMSALGGQMQLKAFPEQNHDAHISTHLSYMGSTNIKANPAMINILQQHIFEHISLKSQQQLQMKMQQQPMDEVTAQSELSQIEAELTKQYFEMESQVLGGGQQDPLVDLKAKELQIKEQEAMQNAVNEQEKLKLNKDKLQANTAIQKDRIDTTEEIANMRAQNARFITAQRNKG
tara:strand:- start:1950 stop:4196 length:2247 start_codon:yes stop_codon:yes gene_type:complete